MSKAEECQRLEVSASHYTVRSSPDEAAVRVDRWWVDDHVKGPAILELGCADGVGTEMLLQKAARLDVVDGSSKYCDMLSRRIDDPRLNVVNCLYEDFEPAQEYDDIVIARSLEMVADPMAILIRIRTWLKPDGRAHVVVQNADSLHRRIGHALGLLPGIDSISPSNTLIGNRRIYTKEMLLQQLGAANLQVIQIKGYLLKPLDWSTLAHAAVDLSTQLIPALYTIGKSVPDDLCHFYYACCTPPSPDNGGSRIQLDGRQPLLRDG